MNARLVWSGLGLWIAAMTCWSCSEPQSAPRVESETPVAAASDPNSAPKPVEPVVAEPPTAEAETASNPTVSAGAKLGRAKSDLMSIEHALQNYAINNSGRFPDTLEPLITPDVNGKTYLRSTKPLKDPWGNEYLYEAPSPSSREPRVYTLGRDGAVGGSGEDADIDVDSIRSED